MPQQKPTEKTRLPLIVSRPSLLADGSDTVFRSLPRDMLAFSSVIQDVRSRLGQVIALSGDQYTLLTAMARLSEDGKGIAENHVAEHLHLCT